MNLESPSPSGSATSFRQQAKEWFQKLGIGALALAALAGLCLYIATTKALDHANDDVSKLLETLGKLEQQAEDQNAQLKSLQELGERLKTADLNKVKRALDMLDKPTLSALINADLLHQDFDALNKKVDASDKLQADTIALARHDVDALSKRVDASDKLQADTITHVRQDFDALYKKADANEKLQADTIALARHDVDALSRRVDANDTLQTNISVLARQIGAIYWAAEHASRPSDVYKDGGAKSGIFRTTLAAMSSSDMVMQSHTGKVYLNWLPELATYSVFDLCYEDGGDEYRFEVGWPHGIPLSNRKHPTTSPTYNQTDYKP